jgi:hypothetical protein
MVATLRRVAVSRVAGAMKNQRRTKAAQPGMWRGRGGTGRIVSDPDPEGGFRTGAEIANVRFMLELGSFTVGTVIQYHGKRWRVHRVAEHQRLVRCGR